MKRLVLCGALSLALVGLGGVAHAKGTNNGGGGNDTGAAQYKKVTNYDFDNDDVTGELVRPDGDFIGARKLTVHSSLIKLRANFVPEMLKEANEI